MPAFHTAASVAAAFTAAANGGAVFLLSSLTQDTKYVVQVRAKNARGGLSNLVCVLAGRESVRIE